MPRKAGITDEMVLKMYQDGLSYKEMSNLIGITDRAIRNIIYKNGVKADRSGPPRLHKINENFFDIWTNEMAWILGLIITDGNLPKQNYSTITITQKDEKILKLIAEYMEADYVIGPLYKTRQTPTLFLNSAKIRKRLNEFGITSNKSLVVPFPDIPEKFMPSFIRGVIDGDGWVQDRGYVMNITSGSKKFADGLSSVFNNWSLCNEITSEVSTTGNEIFRIWVKGKDDLAKLSKIVYKDCNDNCVTKKRIRMSQHIHEQLL